MSRAGRAAPPPQPHTCNFPLFSATHVPVGEDQTQHLELTRDLASAINERFGEAIFTIPAAYSGRLGADTVVFCQVFS